MDHAAITPKVFQVPGVPAVVQTHPMFPAAANAVVKSNASFGSTRSVAVNENDGVIMVCLITKYHRAKFCMLYRQLLTKHIEHQHPQIQNRQ